MSLVVPVVPMNVELSHICSRFLLFIYLNFPFFNRKINMFSYLSAFSLASFLFFTPPQRSSARILHGQHSLFLASDVAYRVTGQGIIQTTCREAIVLFQSRRNRLALRRERRNRLSYFAYDSRRLVVTKVKIERKR